MKRLIILLTLIALVQIGFGQCNISIVNTTTDTLFVPCASSVVLERDTLGSFALNNDFNSGTIGPGWQSNASAQLNNPCGVKSSTYLWLGPNAANPRELTTVPLDLSCGGQICFEFRMAIQSDPSPCEGPDQPDEGVALQYQLPGSSVWDTIFYFEPNQFGSLNAAYPGAGDYTAWTTYCYAIPSAAELPNVQLRWGQEFATGGSSGTSPYDHWGLDSITVSLNCGNIENLWSTGDTTRFTNGTIALQDETYWVRRIVGANSVSPDTCFDSVVVSPQNPIINLQPAYDPFCTNADADIFINPANSQYIDTNYTYLYQWGPAALFDSTAPNYALIENLSFDTSIHYQIMHPVYPQCVGYDTVSISVSGVEFDSISTRIPECFRDINSSAVFFSWTKELSPPITTLFRNGVWTSATIADSFTNLASDTFTLIIEDVRCSDTLGFRFTTPDTVKPDTSKLILDLCQLQEKVQVVNGINGTAPYEVFWDGVSVDPLRIKAYNDTIVDLYIVDDKGCQSLTYPISFEVPDPLAIVQIDTGLCPMTELPLYASTTGGLGPDYYEYTWHSGLKDSLITVYPRPGNSYGVTVEDHCVFPIDMTPNVTVFNVPDEGLTVTPEICLGDSVILQAPYQMEYYRIAIDNYDTLDQPFNVIYPKESGTYETRMRIVTPLGCEKLDTTSFIVYDYPEAAFSYDSTQEYQVRRNAVVDFTNESVNNASNQWVFRNEIVGSSEDLSYEFEEAGRHFIELRVSNPLGCSDSTTGMVIIAPDQGLFIPNSFTPNGDNLNDTWEFYVPDHVDEFDLWVIDRWGTVVWESHDRENNVWDGTSSKNGEKVPSGTYVYRLYIASPESELDYQEELSGTLQIIH